MDDGSARLDAAGSIPVVQALCVVVDERHAWGRISQNKRPVRGRNFVAGTSNCSLAGRRVLPCNSQGDSSGEKLRRIFNDRGKQ